MAIVVISLSLCSNSSLVELVVVVGEVDAVILDRIKMITKNAIVYLY